MSFVGVEREDMLKWLVEKNAEPATDWFTSKIVEIIETAPIAANDYQVFRTIKLEAEELTPMIPKGWNKFWVPGDKIQAHVMMEDLLDSTTTEPENQFLSRLLIRAKRWPPGHEQRVRLRQTHSETISVNLFIALPIRDLCKIVIAYATPSVTSVAFCGTTRFKLRLERAVNQGLLTAMVNRISSAIYQANPAPDEQKIVTPSRDDDLWPNFENDIRLESMGQRLVNTFAAVAKLIVRLHVIEALHPSILQSLASKLVPHVPLLADLTLAHALRQIL